MRILLDSHVNAASIFLELPARGTDVVVCDDVIATVDDGRLTAIELLDAARHGDIENPVVAELVVSWVRAELMRPATA